MTQDMVNSPSHYRAGGYEVIDFMKLLTSTFGEAYTYYSYWILNVVKYLARAKFKGKEKEDLKKAAWYLNDLINYMNENKVLYSPLPKMYEVESEVIKFAQSKNFDFHEYRILTSLVSCDFENALDSLERLLNKI